jgi:hypothetical protein
MLSHGQYSRALSGLRCPDSGEAQSRERVKFIKIVLVLDHLFALILLLATFPSDGDLIDLNYES